MKATKNHETVELNIKPIQKLKLIMILIPGEVIKQSNSLGGGSVITKLLGTPALLRPEDAAPRKAEMVLEQVGYQNDTTKQ